MSRHTPSKVTNLPVSGRNRRLAFGIVGCGAMGGNHARIISELKGAELAAACDIDETALNNCAKLHNCLAFRDYRELVGHVDAVCLAVPASFHPEVASFFVESKIPFLIEKPLASDPVASAKLADEIGRSGLPVLVGHIERFNPAFVKLSEVLKKANQLIAVDIRRLSYASARITDVDVVTDLMIHDIDIVLSLLNGDAVESVQSCGYGRDPYNFDYVTTIMRSHAGKIFTLTASRITPNKLREISATTDAAHIKVDLIDQNLLIQHRGYVKVSNKAAAPDYSIELGVEKVVVRHDEPLMSELRHFISCVRHGTKPIIDAHDAHRAVEMSYRIKENARSNFAASPSRLAIGH